MEVPEKKLEGEEEREKLKMEEPMEAGSQVAPSAIEENLNLFSIPAQDVGVLQKHWVSVRPINAIGSEIPLEFNIDGNGSNYIDLQSTTLCIKFKITKQDGTDIPATAEVAPVNLFLASMWKQVDVQLNYETLKSCNNYYPYKAMFDALLFTNNDYKEGQLAAQMFYKDTAFYMDSDNSTSGGNEAFNFRRERVVGGQQVEMEGNLFLDIFQQERLILNGVQLNIKFFPSENAFKFMSSDDPPEHKIKILDANLKLCLITVNPEIMVAQRNVMGMNIPALYPFQRSEVRVYSMATSEMNLVVENLFNGEVPHFLCVAFVSTKAFNGDYHANPFNFANFNVNSVRFCVNGQSLPYESPFRPDYSKNIFTQPFLALNGDKKGNQWWYNGINLEDFAGGYAMYVFDVRNAKELKRKGLTKLEVGFEKGLSESVTCIVYAKIPDLLEIDQFNKVVQS